MGAMINNQDFDAQFNEATTAGIAALGDLRAKTARYDSTRRQVIVEQTNGRTFILPADMGQGLANATNDELAEVEVIGKDFGLHWEKLDADLSIAALLVGIFGSNSWVQ